MSHTCWPLFDFEVHTPSVTLRYVDDDLGVQLGDLAARGIHDPDWMPFASPWSNAPSPELERSALQFYWRSRADTTPTRWYLAFAVLADGVVIGCSTLGAADFPTTRTFETGSWLGREYQRQGFGTELRLATLHAGFDALLAEEATTGAFDDNLGSLGVTRKLGYRPNGQQLHSRLDAAGTTLRFRMTRSDFDSIRRDDVVISGAENVRELLQIPAA